MNLDFQITEYPEWRDNKINCNPKNEEINKTSDMNNKLTASTYIKTITEENDRHSNEKPENQKKTIINGQNKTKK